MSRALLDLLVKEKVIQAPQMEDALKSHPQQPMKALFEKKVLAENKLLVFLSQKFSLPSVNLAKFEINQDTIKLLPPDLAKKYQVVPIQANKGTLVIAMADPTNLSALEDLKFRLRMNVEAVLTTFSTLEQVLIQRYGGAAAAISAATQYQKKQTQELNSEEKPPDAGFAQFTVHNIDEEEGGAGPTDSAPIIRVVNGILSECIRLSASDIHIEPYEKRFRVRLRIDGVMKEVMEIPIEMKRAVVARFKIMSRMDITETRKPQDGRIKLKSAGREIDFRVNTLPTLFGEKVVLRMLSQGNLNLDLEKMGFSERQLKDFRKGIYSPEGMVLVTGPTGSGKTTTLYSALAELNKITDNISTAEDPVEYNLEGINQVQINKEVGLTFAEVLRALLRQDPDIILVGEIRDLETAEIAVQAALTGHLVLSTLHTNDAPSTITRMLNMGVQPFLITAAVKTVLAQRLLRGICPKCKVEQKLEPQVLIDAGFSESQAQSVKLYRGEGCSTCSGTGYKGRVAVHEVMNVSEPIKELVLKGASASELKKKAVEEGMTTLRGSALEKAAQGRTTLEEAVSATADH